MRRFSNQKGLTLVEAMFGLVILTLGFIPLVTLISSVTNVSFLVRSNLVAANLAQEGAEIVRSMRDSNWFNGLPFDRGLSDCGQSVCIWRVDWNSTSLMGIGANTPLKFDSSTGLYNYSTGFNTSYVRRIIIERVGTCNCEVKVISEVTWSYRGKIRTVNVESHLFNWL